MFNHSQMAHVYGLLAEAYIKIDSYEKQEDALNSLNKEKYTCLEEYCETLRDVLASKDILIRDYLKEIDLLHLKLEEDDQREGQFPSEF